jgi:hypothetical protein
MKKLEAISGAVLPIPAVMVLFNALIPSLWHGKSKILYLNEP